MRIRKPHDGLDWGQRRPPTVAEVRAWLADKPDTALVEARDNRIWVTNHGERDAFVAAGGEGR